MSTQPHSDHVDLDRTDELPRLDVEAYEAQLAAEGNETLGSTDAWAVQSLRDAEEEEAQRDLTAVHFPRTRTAPPEPPKTSDVTLDATRILGRIQQLESELALATEHEAQLQSRIEKLSSDLATKEKETRGLSADNARLTEQRASVTERLRALEQQFQADAARHERELTHEREARAVEQAAATKASAAFEAQLTELKTLAARMRDDNARLEDDAKAATKLGKTQIELIEEFKQRLASEEKNSAQLARHLAAKIAEHATADQEIARRDAAIAQRDVRIAELDSSAVSLQARIASLQQQLANEHATQDEKHNRYLELERTLDERQSRCETLARELESMRARMQQLDEEAKRGEAAREMLEAKTSELRQVQEDLARAHRELDEIRASLVTKHSEVAERDQALRAAQEVAAELRKLNASLEQSIEDTRLRSEELEARDREREASVLANAADLAAARRQLGQQLAAVQSMEVTIRARDTLTERLRAELQVSQDERAIMAGQLEKSRARNKSMAREIFARDNQIASLKADLAVHAETLAAIRQDVSRATAADADHPDRILEPVGHDGDIIALDKKMMTIGRTIDSDICIPSKLVSRNHARLLIGPNAVILEDAGSTNGCLVNDVPVKQQLMREGDVLSIGDLKYRLRTRNENATRARNNVIPFG